MFENKDDKVELKSNTWVEKSERKEQRNSSRFNHNNDDDYGEKSFDLGYMIFFLFLVLGSAKNLADTCRRNSELFNDTEDLQEDKSISKSKK